MSLKTLSAMSTRSVIGGVVAVVVPSDDSLPSDMMELRITFQDCCRLLKDLRIRIDSGTAAVSCWGGIVVLP